MTKVIKTETYQDIPVRMAISVVKRFHNKTGVNLLAGQKFSELTVDHFEMLFLYCAEKGAKVEKVTCKVNEENLEDVFDEAFPQFLQLMPEFFKQLTGKGEDTGDIPLEVVDPKPEMQTVTEVTEAQKKDPQE